MIKKEFIWISEYGLHARPAGKLVSIASQLESSITLETLNQSADAKGLFGLMGLKLKKDEKFILHIEGSDESKAQKLISEFLTEELAKEA